MNVFDKLIGGDEQPQRGRIHGVVIGIVTDNKDPEQLGRVCVRFPWLSDKDVSNWARVAAPMAGQGRGMFFLPESGDEVLVAFEHGDPRFPYVLGALWNCQDTPPETNADGNNDVRVIRSRSGHVIRFTDTQQGEKIEVIDSTGDNKITIDSAANKILISAASGTIRLDARKIEIVGDIVNIN